MELARYISPAFESIFKRPCPRELMEASEGDARRYLRKVLENNGLAGELASEYGPDWTGEAFNSIRDEFVHKGCDVYFVPGLARILYGELDYDSPDQDSAKVDELRDLVKFISTAHKGEFSRNLEHITAVTEGPRKGMKVRSEPFTFAQLRDMFSREQKAVSDSDRESLEKEGLTPTGYEIIELTDFAQASRYADYTNPQSRWCYLDDEDTFEDYREGGNRLYLALKPGFEDLEPGDPGYGRSMIGFDMGPLQPDGTSKMCVCTNRYNHGENLENEEGAGKGDSAYDEITLSKILGIPVWKDCPGYTREQLLGLGRLDIRMLSELVPDLDTAKEWAENPDTYQEKYGLCAEKTGHSVSSGVYKFVNRRGIAVAYVFEERSSGKPLWTTTIGYLPEERLLVKPFDEGYGIVDRAGTLLTGDTLFAVVNAYHSDCFPIPVGVHPGGEEGLEWNYVDRDGKLLLGEGLLQADKFNLRGLARVIRKDWKAAVIGKDMKPVTGWVDKVNLVASNSFLLSKDGKLNVLAGGKLVFDPWLMYYSQYNHLVAEVGSERGFNLYNTVSGDMYPEWFHSMSVGHTGAGGRFVVRVVRQEDRKVNYIVEDGSLRDPTYELDTWLDAGGTLSGGQDSTYGILAGQKVKIEYDGKHVTVGGPVDNTGKGLYDW